MDRKLVITNDGSHTLRLGSQDEHYHSVYGAISESRHVFIEAGLHFIHGQAKGDIRILEVGFGTGLNALLTLIEGGIHDRNIYYYTLEPYPLEAGIWKELNYPKMLGGMEIEKYFEALHSTGWGNKLEIRKGFKLNKIKLPLEEYLHKGEPFNLVYFDAFAPDVQPGLWTEDIFRKIADMTSPGGVLVTYSCKGNVKRALRNAGFEIEKLPGPEGKREMLRGFRC